MVPRLHKLCIRGNGDLPLLGWSWRLPLLIHLPNYFWWDTHVSKLLQYRGVLHDNMDQYTSPMTHMNNKYHRRVARVWELQRTTWFVPTYCVIYTFKYTTHVEYNFLCLSLQRHFKSQFTHLNQLILTT